MRYFRYGFLLVKDNACQDPLSMSVAILQQFDILPELYQVGYTKLYFRAGQVSLLLYRSFLSVPIFSFITKNNLDCHYSLKQIPCNVFNYYYYRIKPIKMLCFLKFGYIMKRISDLRSIFDFKYFCNQSRYSNLMKNEDKYANNFPTISMANLDF